MLNILVILLFHLNFLKKRVLQSLNFRVIAKDFPEDIPEFGLEIVMMVGIFLLRKD